MLMFKAENNLLPKYLKDLFIIQDEENRRYILRNSDFTMPHFNTVKYEKHSQISGTQSPFLWSRLTKGERDKNSLSALNFV